MGTILVNQTNGGMLQQYGYSTWSALRNTSTALNVSVASGQIRVANQPSFKEINRVYLSFDTSTFSTMNITSLILNVNATYIQGTPSFIILKSPKDNSTNLNTTHFGIYTAAEYNDNPIYPTVNGWYTIELNGNAIIDSTLNGEIDLVLVNYEYDYVNSSPPSNSVHTFNFLYNTAYLEYESSVYIAPDSIPTYGKINGIDSGSIGKINGLSVVV
jgi:hypothetical protein